MEEGLRVPALRHVNLDAEAQLRDRKVDADL
jgi:hypothetical protein